MPHRYQSPVRRRRAATNAARLARLRAAFARRLVTAILSCLSSACSGDLIPNAPGATVPAPAPAATPDTTPALAVPTRLGNAPLVRRLGLDLGIVLPAAADATLLASSADNFNLLIDTYLSDRRAPEALAALHTRMWHRSSDYLPDLDGFAAAGGTTLSTALTPARRQEISLEPNLTIRWVIDQGLALGEAFTQNEPLVSHDLLGLWQQSSQQTAFVGEPVYLASYAAARPAAGILAGNGFLAGFASRGEAPARQRTSQVLGEVLCLGLTGGDGHKFNTLSATELSEDLRVVALARPECATCHTQFEDPARAFGTVATGTSFSAWLNYQLPAASVTGHYAGQAFTGLDGMAALVAKDPRLAHCEATKVLTTLYQRQFNAALDTATAANAESAYYKANQNLPALSRQLLLSTEYGYAPLAAAKGAHKLSSTGIKFLTRAQWQGLIEVLAPGTTSIVVTDQLDPGHSESFTSDDAIPSGTYWHAVDSLSRQLGPAIVATELADGVPATSRKLLTALADGSGAGASSTVVAAQIKAAWLLLTGEALADSDATFQAFTTLWTSAKIGTSASESRRGWGLMLVAMLSHPKFVSY